MLEINLSSSALGHSGCMLNLQRTVITGYKEKALASRMVYGIGVHKFIDVMYKTGGHIPTAREEAMKAFASVPRIDDRKSMHLSDITHMTTVALYVWQMCVVADKDFEILELDGKPATEVTYSIPFFNDENVMINWCGTLDRIGKIKNGIYIVPDWKTTSSWSEKEYFSKFEMARQPRGYILALKLMSELYPDSVLGKIGATNVGARFDGVFVKPAANDVKFGRSEVFQYKPAEIQEFRDLLTAKCKEISLAVQRNEFTKQGLINGSCEGRWGKCAFWGVCQHPEPVANILLKRDFDIKPFNPLAYND